jgi:probable phosphoglycerate mutase
MATRIGPSKASTPAGVQLSARGRAQAREAGQRLAGRSFDHVLVSSQTRALETCELAGFGEVSRRCETFVEWDYGEYERLTDDETQRRQPGWDLFRDGCPGGESPQQVTARLGRLLVELDALGGTCLIVGHGKTLRALAARWVEEDVVGVRKAAQSAAPRP